MRLLVVSTYFCLFLKSVEEKSKLIKQKLTFS